MKKTVLVGILAVLVLFCLISIAVGGFFGWRFYQRHKITQASIKSAVEKQIAENVPNQETNQPQAAPEEAQPEQTQPQEAPQAEPGATSQEAPQVAPTAPSAAEAAPKASAKPAPVREAVKKRPASKPAPEPAPATPAPEAAAASAPHTKAAPAPPIETTAPAAEPAPEKKKPHGTLGLIFESKLDQGEVIIHVDGKVVAAKAFTASPENRFRLTKGLRLIPGPHRVKVKVTMPDGKSQVKEWTVMVVKGGDTVWKIEMKRFPRTLDIKPIT